MNFEVSFVDAPRAFFNSPCHEHIYVDLPSEDYQEGKCGRLLRWMYGTRKAASKWEDQSSSVLLKTGFSKGEASPCAFFHESRQLRCVVHGDDFTTLGNDTDLDWMKKTLQQAFEVKVRGRLGSGERDVREIRILNRIARCTADGFVWESDPRHAELILQQLGLTSASSLSSPGTGARQQP
eukprot:16186930-Heterocapsa_arctica.AAC.1